MIKTKTIETVEEFDENGKLVRKTTTEIEETDDNPKTGFMYPYHFDTGFHYDPGPSCTCKDGK